VAKTYPAIGPFAPGDILTAATMTNIDTNLENQRVPPMVRAQRTSTSAALAGNDPIPFNSEAYDTDGMWEGVTNPSRITANTAGVYLFTGSLRITGTSAFSQVNFYAKKNNGTEQYWQNALTFTGTFFSAAVAFTISLAANDYVQIFTGHGGGGTVTANGSATELSCNLSATWLGQVS
jgi:hypothetical protein